MEDFREPIQMPRGKKYGANYWTFHSIKNNRHYEAYSNLEFENMVCLEMDPEVERYTPQPLEVSVIIDGKLKNTVFDVWVRYKDGREEFQEVKYQEELDSDTPEGERSRKQISAQKAWCLQNGMDYVVRTDKEIHKGQFYVRNLRFLFGRVKRMSLLEKNVENVLKEYLKKTCPTTVGYIDSTGRFENNRTFDYLAYFFYKGIITFSNIEDEFVSNKSEVIWNGK